MTERHHDKRGSEADGYAVVIDDKDSAPAGYWFVSTFTARDLAESVAKGQKGARVVPVYFGSPSAIQPMGYIVAMDRGVGPYVGCYRTPELAEAVAAKQPAGHSDIVIPVYAAPQPQVGARKEGEPRLPAVAAPGVPPSVELSADLKAAITRAATWLHRGAPQDECESTISDVVKYGLGIQLNPPAASPSTARRCNVVVHDGSAKCFACHEFWAKEKDQRCPYEIASSTETRITQLERELAEERAKGERKLLDAMAFGQSAGRREGEPSWLWGLLQEQPRPEVIAFAVAMERKLKANDHKGGWHSCGLPYLLRRIKQEVEELETLVCSTPRPPDQVCGEAADVGNFAMMIADVMEALPSVPSAIKTRGNDAP